MSGIQCDPDLAELTPVMLSDNTEVKIPYYGSPEQLIATKIDSSVRKTLFFSPYDQTEMTDFNENVLASGPPGIDEQQLQHLCILYRGYPSTMVYSWLKRIYSSDENRLDSERSDLFALVKQLPDFIY